MTESKLIERQSIAVNDGGQTRIPRSLWRQLKSPESFECDLLELDNGSLEVRIRPQE
jgi:hypothetical protein